LVDLLDDLPRAALRLPWAIIFRSDGALVCWTRGAEMNSQTLDAGFADRAAFVADGIRTEHADLGRRTA